MSSKGYGIINQMYNSLAGNSNEYNNMVTVGTVVDVNDPQQMGRIRILCPTLGDSPEQAEDDVANIPWASYVSPIGGHVSAGSRGPNEDPINGSRTAYGMWSIPEVGAQVLVTCIDGHPHLRVWLGCLYTQFSTHTMPHGRYHVEDDGNVDGPVDPLDGYIQPLKDNYTEAFGDDPAKFEGHTRAADYPVSLVDDELYKEQLGQLADRFVPDAKDVDLNGKIIRQGYAEERIPHDEGLGKYGELTGEKSYSSSVHSWTTPGFHALSMDDRPENCRTRWRTTSGHQIIMDDTNERIYIATAEGKNWIEMDQNGNIDIHSDRRVSVHAAKDINFTTDDTFRVHAQNGIHMHAETGDVRMTAASGNIHAKASGSLNLDMGSSVDVKAATTLKVFSGATMDLKTGAGLNVQSTGNTNVNSGGNNNFESGGTTNIKAGGQIINTGSQVHLNGPPAASAGTATDAGGAEEAYWTNRRPDHEPWPRDIMSSPDTNISHEPLHPDYNDENIGKVEDTPTFTRNPNWRR